MRTLTLSNFNVNYFFISQLCLTLALLGWFWKVGNFTEAEMETTSVRNTTGFSCRLTQHTVADDDQQQLDRLAILQLSDPYHSRSTVYHIYLFFIFFLSLSLSFLSYIYIFLHAHAFLLGRRCLHVCTIFNVKSFTHKKAQDFSQALACGVCY